MEFTEDSRRRLAFVASNTEVDFTAMITLTYPAEFPNNGRLVKEQFKRFLDWLTKTKLPGTSYLWFIEFQRRGAPHYHILLTERVGNAQSWRTFQWDVSKKWNSLVQGGIDHLRAGSRTERLRSPEGGRRYVVKYAQKTKQKVVPAAYENVGRFYGYSKDVAPKPIAEVALNWEQLKRLLGDWNYLPEKEEELFKVLYNTSGAVAVAAVQEKLL